MLKNECEYIGKKRIKKHFLARWASVWSKNKGGPGPLRPLSWIRHCIGLWSSICRCLFH